jgi:SAM-dependent methyltransferase
MGLLEQNEIDFGRGRALDFGCGVGRLTQPLGEVFDEVVGLDISTAMIAKAEAANQSQRLRFVHSESARLPFEDEHFDFILAHLVLLHVGPEAAEAYVKEFARTLAPGGLGIISLPCSSGGDATRRLSRMPVATGEEMAEQQFLIVPFEEMVDFLESLGLQMELQFREGPPEVREFGIYVFRRPA